jgi:WD40 repeat protein
VQEAPLERYQTAGEFAVDLEQVLDGNRVQARPAYNPERAGGSNSDWTSLYAVKLAACEVAVLITVVIVAGGLSCPSDPAREGKSGARHVSAKAHGELAGRTYSHQNDRADGAWKVHQAVHAQQPRDSSLRPGARKTSSPFQGPVRGVAFSPDGRRLAIASKDGDYHTVTLWEWDAPGSRGNELPVRHPGEVNCVAYCPNGRHVASGSADGTLIIFDYETPRLRHRISTRQSSVECLAFSPDGLSIATGGRDGTVVIWNRHRGEKSNVFLPDSRSPVTCLAYSPKGNRLFVGGWDRTVRSLDAQSGHEVWTSAEHGGAVFGLAVDPDGRWVASAADDRKVRLLSAHDGMAVKALSGHDGPVNCVAFGPKRGQLVSGGADHAVRVWDVASGTAVATLHGHTGTVRSVAVSRDGNYVASGSADGTAKVWDANSIGAQAEPE